MILDDIGTSRLGPEGINAPMEPKLRVSSSLVLSADLASQDLESPEQATPPFLIKLHKKRQSKYFDKAKSIPKLRSSKLIINKPDQQQDNSNFFRFMATQKILQKFKDRLLTNAYILPRKLSQAQQLIIDQLKTIHRTIQIEKSQGQNYKILEPQNKFALIWDIFGILFSLVCLWISAFQISFIDDLTSNQITQYVVLYLGLDIIINLNKAILEQGEIIYDRIAILRFNANNYLIQDLINISLWIQLLQQDNYENIFQEISAIIKIILFFDRIRKKFKVYYDQIQLKGNMTDALDLLVLIIYIYFFAHITSCFWHYVANKTEYLGTSWIIQRGIQNETIWIKYNCAFYWATMTMVTVGYGDIVPQNHIEMISCSVIMFISTCVFAYSMNSIGIIVSNINDSQQQFRRQLVLMNVHMKNNQVQSGIQGRVRNYLKFYSDQQQESSIEDINRITNNLPSVLRLELLTDIQMKAITFPINLKFQLVKLLNKQNSLQENLYSINMIIMNKIFYEGEVKLVEENSGQELQVLQQGSELGQYQFFTAFSTQCAAQSLGFCSLYKISRSQLINIIQNNQKDFEKFHHMKDQIIFKDNYQIINLQCNICQNYNHLNNNCPFIRYKFDLERYVKRQNFISNQRVKFKRYAKEKLKSLIWKEDLQQSIKQYQAEYLKLGENDLLIGWEDEQKSERRISVPSQAQGQSEQQKYSLTNMQSIIEQNINLKSLTKVVTNKLPFHQQTLLHETKKFETKQMFQGIGSMTVSNNQLVDSLLEFKQNNLQFHYQVIDKLNSFMNYLPQNNIENILRQMHRRKLINISNFKQTSLYTFYYDVKLQASLYLKKFQENQK